MAESGPRVTSANQFVLGDDEVYAGTSRSEWEDVVKQLDFLKAVKLDDIEPDNQECDICRESFGSAVDDQSPEKPVSLPCGHIFGNRCISGWMTAGRRRDSGEHNHEGGEQVRGFSRTAVYQSPGPNSVADLLPAWEIFRQTEKFTCPKCRQEFTVPILEDQAVAIDARLQFWDRAYERLGIQRSDDEEASRSELWRFVEQMRADPAYRASRGQMRSASLRAQVSAMRFALRRANWDLTPVQQHLRDGMFNLGCFGLGGHSETYCAASYEDRPIPIWCWQFDRVERGMCPTYNWTDGQEHCSRFLADWQRQTLGPWRRALFADLRDKQLVWQSEEWWECWHDLHYIDPDH